jgi:hypothetical protein
MQRPPGEVWNSWQFTGAAAKEMVVCWLWPFKSALTTAFWVVLTVPEIASNVALLWPAGTVTLGGTESSGLLLAIATTESVVAVVSKVTEHLPATWLDIAVGEQNSDLGCPFGPLLAVRVKVWETPLRVAVNRALWLEVTAATVAVNVALLSPAPILTLPGTVTLVLLLASVTLAALEAAAVKVAVQVEVAGPVTELGEQVKLLNWVAAVAVRLKIACLLWPL